MKPTLSSAEDLGEVFQAHQAELVRLAAFILGDRGTGEDVVQDVFVRMHQRKHPMDGDLLPTCALQWSTIAVARYGGGC
jgi:DNA-directed RNA polymerase specialized sigma24 family protein